MENFNISGEKPRSFSSSWSFLKGLSGSTHMLSEWSESESMMLLEADGKKM